MIRSTMSKGAHFDLLIKQGFKCKYCGHPIAQARGRDKKVYRVSTLDHVIPKSKGGTNCKENIVAACVNCNSLKGEDSVYELMRKLKTETKEE